MILNIFYNKIWILRFYLCMVPMSPCPTKNVPLSDKCPLVRQKCPLVRQKMSPCPSNVPFFDKYQEIVMISWEFVYHTPFNWGKILIKRCITSQTTYQRHIWYSESNLGNQLHHYLDLFAICFIYSIKQLALAFTKPLQATPEASKRGPKARYAASY